MAAVDGLAAHALTTELVPLHADALAAWPAVVRAARESSVVFNAIDHGMFFDYAVTALCCALRVPYVTGASYGHTAIAEAFSGQPGDPCWACHNAPPHEAAVLAQLAPDKARVLFGCLFIMRGKGAVPVAL